MIRGLARAACGFTGLLPLAGCLTVSFGVPHARGPADAIMVRQVGLGVWRMCGSVGLGIASGTCVMARPGSNVAVVNGRIVTLAKSEGVTHALPETPLRSAGGDRP